MRGGLARDGARLLRQVGAARAGAGDCGVSRDGSNALNIVKAARSYGLIAKGFRYEPEELKETGKFPCIVHWEFNRFAVLNGFRGNKAIINDPARGNCAIPMVAFDKSFTGIHARAWRGL